MLKKLKRFKLVGGRVVKTGLSVLITASICQHFNLPVTFAVITAIVTTEPTAADSIKKGMIRFPASAIGAALAVTFSALLGDTALTYSLAATFTIVICHKLKLDPGILVATLTAVAMIPETNDHFLSAFFTRLGTTSIGIVVSTVVNFLVLPAKFTPIIFKNINNLYELAGDVLDQTMMQLLLKKTPRARQPLQSYKKLTSDIERTIELCNFQRNEWKYHRHSTKDMRALQYAQKKLHMLQQIIYHLGNIQYIKLVERDFVDEERDILLKTTKSIKEILTNPTHSISREHYAFIQQLDNQFWDYKVDVHMKNDHYHHHFDPQTVLLYEILSLHDTLEELEKIAHHRYKLLV